MEACSVSAEASDGRNVFMMTANGQLQMPRLGNFCLSTVGDGVVETDVALGADVTATSSSTQHSVNNAVDGDGGSFWASGVDPASVVDLNIDFGGAKQIRAVEIDWEYQAQASCCYLSNSKARLLADTFLGVFSLPGFRFGGC